MKYSFDLSRSLNPKEYFSFLNHDFYCLPNNWRNFDAEYSHEVKKYNNKQQSTQTHDKHKYNRNAMLLSLIPGGGWGELYKGQKWGWAIVGSEAANLSRPINIEINLTSGDKTGTIKGNVE